MGCIWGVQQPYTLCMIHKCYEVQRCKPVLQCCKSSSKQSFLFLKINSTSYFVLLYCHIICVCCCLQHNSHSISSRGEMYGHFVPLEHQMSIDRANIHHVQSWAEECNTQSNGGLQHQFRHGRGLVRNQECAQKHSVATSCQSKVPVQACKSGARQCLAMDCAGCKQRFVCTLEHVCMLTL